MASVGLISNYFGIPKNITTIDSRACHASFNYEWKTFIQQFDQTKEDMFMLDNNEEATKLSSSLVHDLAELIKFNSSSVTVRTSTFGTSNDFFKHFITHLSNEIFAKDGVSFIGNDINNSLKLAELIYTDDSIIRFLPELIIKPKNEHEKEISIIGSPIEILDWVFDCEKLYYKFIERKLKKNDLLAVIDYLHKGRYDVIKIAMEMSMYLPISPRTIISEDKDELYNRITKNWMRNKKVDSNIVLNYLYLNEIKNLIGLGLIPDEKPDS
jgi:hypothetical protein